MNRILVPHDTGPDTEMTCPECCSQGCDGPHPTVEKLFDSETGKLVEVRCLEVYPGDGPGGCGEAYAVEYAPAPEPAKEAPVAVETVEVRRPKSVLEALIEMMRPSLH